MAASSGQISCPSCMEDCVNGSVSEWKGNWNKNVKEEMTKWLTLWEVSNSGKIWLSQLIFYVKNHLNLSHFFPLQKSQIGPHLLLLTFLDTIISDSSPVHQFSKFNIFLWVCCQYLSNFVSPDSKPHHQNYLSIIWLKSRYCISSYSFHGNYSFLNWKSKDSHYIRPKVTVHKGAETIQGRKLFKGGNYMRKYGILSFSLKGGTKAFVRVNK